jgi:outer membrane receptor protein involved in Fe transport
MARRISWTGLLLGAGVSSTLALSILPAAAQDVVPTAASTPGTAAAVKKQGQGAANPVQPAQPSQDSQAPTLSDTSTGGVSPDVLGSVTQQAAAPRQAETTASPGTTNVAATPESASRATTDVGDFLSKSEAALGVEVQRRSPVVTDPTIRGRRAGQITTYLDGGWAYPARIDLDTIVSKIDSTMIRDVIVVKGPYNVRYGAGFTFLDIATTLPPRYDCGPEHHVHILSGFKSNGQQLRERGELYGGGHDYGYRIGYTLGVGNDYQVPEPFIFQGVNFGNNIPSSYNTQSLDYAFGFDIDKNSSLTFYGVNLFQRNIELPGMPFDFRRLEAQSYSLRHEYRDCCLFDRLTTDAWYAYTHFTGDNGIMLNTTGEGPPLQPLPGYGKRTFYYNPLVPPFQSGEPRGFFPDLAIAVSGGAMTTGIRQIATWGQPSAFEFNLGWDLRYLSQRNDEFDFFTATTGPTGFTNYPVPRSHQLNRGLFADAVATFDEQLIVKSGGRVDITNVDVDSFKQGLTENQIRQALGNDNLNSEYLLWNGYVSSEYKLNSELAVLAGVGTGQRPPSLTELYAISPYSAQIQRTFHFFRGNPNLAPEQAVQVDGGFRGDYQWFRVGANAFATWVHNYITFQPQYDTLPPEVFELTPQDPPPGPGNIRDSLEFRYMNTNLAFLTGFEAYVDATVLPWLTGYATANYVRGTDLTRGDRVTPEQIAGGLFPSIPDNEPLPSIVPFESRLGVRVHDTNIVPRWSVDFSARIVDAQNRVARSLGEEPTPGFTVYDLRTYWQVNERWAFNAGIENVFDRFYQEHLDIRTGRGVFQPGRNYYIVAELRY